MIDFFGSAKREPALLSRKHRLEDGFSRAMVAAVGLRWMFFGP